MYALSTLLLALLASIVQIASAATPPACLIAALEAQPNPSDLKALCGTLESSMVSNITHACASGIESAALSVYSATCLAQGVTITLPTSTSSSASATGSASTTGTAKATSTASATGTHTTSTAVAKTGTATSSSATSTSTNAANIASPRVGGMIAALMAVGCVAAGLL